MKKATNQLKQRIREKIRPGLKTLAVRVLKQFGLELLTEEQTRDYLKPHQLSSTSSHQVMLPTVLDAVVSAKVLFCATQVDLEPIYVWGIAKQGKKASLLRCGSLLFDHKLLLTDFTIDAFEGPLLSKKRVSYHTKTLIAPWSQYFQGTPPNYTYKRWISFGGYFDFMMLVATKLCRIKDALPDHTFSEAVVAYPLINSAYEREILSLLGFREEQILDSRQYAISFDTCVLGDTGNSSWRYPNAEAVASLKHHIEGCVSVKPTNQSRIYIRRSGRRRILNEETLIELLEQYDFKIIEDVPRSIAEQVAIYKNAKFILGPHGASFTNIIWCEPGTHLFELFNPLYVPDYFLYLSQLLGLQYSAYSCGDSVQTRNDALSADIFVSFSELDICLKRILGTDPIRL